MKHSHRLKIQIIVGLILLTTMYGTAFSQSSISHWAEYLEQLCEENETAISESDILETLEYYHENKININDTSSQELLNLFFINEYQHKALKAYIAQNGQLLSAEELKTIYSFDLETVRLLTPFIKGEPFHTREQLELRKIVRHGKSNLTAGWNIYPQKLTSNADSTHLGDPSRLYFRYRFQYKDNIIFTLSGDKDSGEELFGNSQKQGFDFYSLSLLIKNIGKLKALAIGSYNVQLGQGLTFWNGSNINFNNSFLKTPTRHIKAAGAFDENNFLNGAATEVEISKHLSITTFFSIKHCDANFTVDSNSNYVFNSLYTSGLHRTENEILKKNTLDEQIIGGHIKYSKNTLNLGLSYYPQSLSSPIVPKENFYNYFYFKGDENQCLGVDFCYLYKRIILFGESTWDIEWNNATMAGLKLYANSSTIFTLYARCYDKAFNNTYASALGKSSNIKNEKGIGANLSCILPGNIHATANVDLYHFPHPKYQIYSPSNGMEYKLKLAKEFGNHTYLQLTLRHQNKAKNIASANSNSHIAYPENYTLNHLQLLLNYSPSDTWNVNRRIVVSKSPTCKSHGFAMSQEAAYKPPLSNIQLAARYTIFDVEEFENVIYSYEQDLPLQMYVPQLYGVGSRILFIAKWTMKNNIALHLKYGIYIYQKNSSTLSGSSYNKDRLKQEIKLQLNIGRL